MEHRNTWRAAALLSCLLAGGMPALAQGPPRGRPPDRPQARGGPGDPAADEEMRAALEQVMIVRLKRALRLTPEQEGRVMPRVGRLQEARHDYATHRRVAVSHLRALMIDETANEADIGKALAAVREMDDAFRDRERRLKQDIEKELTPRQQARLYFFEGRFRRAMQRRMFEAMQRGRPGGPPDAGPGRGPDLPEDDEGPGWDDGP